MRNPNTPVRSKSRVYQCMTGLLIVFVCVAARAGFHTTEAFSTGGSSSSNAEVSRRGWINKTTIGGAVVVGGLVANKIAIRGPEPFVPPPNSLTNKVIVITGGNTGLGYESAKRLAKGGATIVITSRNVEKGQKAVDLIKQQTGNSNVYSVSLDLCDLENIKTFPERLKSTLASSSSGVEGDESNATTTMPRVDVLLNNAGVMAVPERELTKDGYERHFQTNHLGHFALTALLFPYMANENARVINVSSAAHQFAGKGLNFDNLNGEESYGPWSAYGASKLENIYFTQELQRRVDDSTKKNFKTFSLHPGAVRTDLSRYLMGENDFVSMMDDSSKKPPMTAKTLLLLPLVYFTKSVERGATTQIWLAAGGGDAELKGGEYLQNKKALKLSSTAQDPIAAKKLWDASEQMSGLKFEV